MNQLHSAPLLSIISITRNDLPGITRTFQSLHELLKEGNEQVELIIIDGGDAPANLVPHSFSSFSKNVRIFPQKTSGLYEAMNEGIAASTGRFVWFLNGGDENCANWKDIEDVLAKERSEVILFDYLYRSDKTVKSKKSRKPYYLWHALPTSHQAILYSRTGEFGQIYYPTGYRICSDYAFTCLYKAQSAKFQVEHIRISIFDGNGVSFSRGLEIGREANEIQATILKEGKVLRAASRLLHRLSFFIRKRNN